MKFRTFGGFKIERNKHLVAHDKKDRDDFWANVEEVRPGLSESCGCYIFVIKNRVWYVGMAEKQTFKEECFALHKITQYNEALRVSPGIPKLLFLPKMTPGGRFAKPTSRGHRDIQMLESLLIGTALTKNPQLRNVKGTKLLREMNVPGFLNSGQGQGRPVAVQFFKKAMGLD